MKVGVFLLSFIFLSFTIQAQKLKLNFSKISLESVDSGQLKMSSIIRNVPCVVVLCNPECPISQKYTPILRGMIERFSSIKFLVVFTKWDNWQEIKTFQKDYPLSISTFRDVKNHFVKKIKADITPEVFFFDKNAVLLYRGAIDNWFYNLGKHRPEATECYLEEAIDAYLKNEIIKIKKTNAVGCIIEK
jgi:hypothetical protein